jgi:hypothetical protein
MFDRVVIGWDGSPAAESALDWALRRRGTRELSVLRVVQPDPEGAGASRIQVLDGVERAVHETRRVRPDVLVTAAIVEGAPDDVLRRWAVHGSLLVLGASDRTPDHPGAGLAERVALTAGGPVAVVPEGSSGRRGEVVVGIDGTEASAAAAEIAAAEAADQQTALRAVHVVRGPRGTEVRLGGTDASSLAHRFPALLIRHLHVHGDPSLELTRASGLASVLVLGRHPTVDPRTSVALPVLARIGVPAIVVGPDDAVDPLPEFVTTPA